VSFRIAAVQRQFALDEEHHQRRRKPLTPEANGSQKALAQIARIPHQSVCRIQCTCAGFFGRPGFFGFFCQQKGGEEDDGGFRDSALAAGHLTLPLTWP
jgi:hypothetical protein